jgi:hypothetical protein
VTDRHPTEDALVLQYYGELSGEERAEIDAHVAACPACAAAREALGAALDRVGAAEVPEPDADFETRMWTRVRAALPPRPAAWHERPVVALGAIAALVVLGVLTGYLLQMRSMATPVPTPPDARGADSREGVLLTALTDHFSQTEILLVELLNATSAEDANWAFQRSAADDLVASGRLYRQTARQTGELQLVNMLDDLEGVLVEVARAPDAVDPRDADFLRARIEDDALLFKVRAVATDIRGRQQRWFETH